MTGRLTPWHWIGIAAHGMLALLLLWFALAYGGLPRLWSHHEHKKIAQREQITAFTAQDIPADPINLLVVGSREALTCAFRQAGWSVADPVSLWSGIAIGASVLLHHAYPQAPVSNLYVRDRVQDIAFEKADGRSADRRHHVRFWRIGGDRWLGAATFDRGVGLSLYTLQITHHIGPDIDAERDTVGRLLFASDGRRMESVSARMSPGAIHRNGGGDRYQSDGRIGVYIAEGCGHRPATESSALNMVTGGTKPIRRFSP